MKTSETLSCLLTINRLPTWFTSREFCAERFPEAKSTALGKLRALLNAGYVESQVLQGMVIYAMTPAGNEKLTELKGK